MDIGCQSWLQKIKPRMPEFLGRVLDVGSLNINGSVREFFPKSSTSEFIGIDMQEGKDVDIVMNAHDLKQKFEAESFDVIFCMNTLEHDDKFWITLENIKYLLKRGGYFVFGSPTYNFPIHKHPKDYYRFLEDSVREIVMEGFRILDLEEVYSKREEDATARHGWRGINPIICALGVKI